MHCTLAFALFLSCLATAYATSPDECAKGEHYWCSSFGNAFKCGAFKHCIATFWKNEISNVAIKPEMINDYFYKCEVCTRVLTHLKLVLKDGPLKKAFKAVLREQVCPMFGDYESTCRMIVEHYADQILDLLAANIEPRAVCEFLHTCSRKGLIFKVTELVKAQSLSKVTGNCEMCKFFIDELKNYIGAHPTREMVEEALEKLCGMLPESFKETCNNFVKKYSDMIIDLILKNLDTQLICEELHFCSVNGCPEMRSTPNSVDKCEVCEITIGFLEGILSKNSTIDEIETAAHRVCHLVPCHYRSFCNDMIDEYLPLIVKALINRLKPHDACVLLNLCNNANVNQYYKCVSGPKYWCASKANAKLCEAEDHCKMYIWK